MEKIEELRKLCIALENDIQELTSEIVNFESSRMNLARELRSIRKELQREIGNPNEDDSSNTNQNQDRTQQP